MLQAYRKSDGFPLDQVDALSSRSTGVEREEEITKVRPVPRRLLSALMDIREVGRREMEDTVESATEAAAVPLSVSGIRELAESSEDAARRPATSNDVDIDIVRSGHAACMAGEIREFLPTEEVLERWFDALCEPVVACAERPAVVHPEPIENPAPGVSAPPDGRPMETARSDDRIVTLLMRNRPALLPSFAPAAANAPSPVGSTPPLAVVYPSRPSSAKQARTARWIVITILSMMVLVLMGYASSRWWSETRGEAHWSVR